MIQDGNYHNSFGDLEIYMVSEKYWRKLREKAVAHGLMTVGVAYWISDNDLWAACEEAGLVKPGIAHSITPKEATEQALAILNKYLKNT